MEFRKEDLKMFFSTLWYDNSDDYEFFWLKNGLPLKIYLGYVFF